MAQRLQAAIAPQGNKALTTAPAFDWKAHYVRLKLIAPFLKTTQFFRGVCCNLWGAFRTMPTPAYNNQCATSYSGKQRDSSLRFQHVNIPYMIYKNVIAHVSMDAAGKIAL
jgi:hypothetical protein